MRRSGLRLSEAAVLAVALGACTSSSDTDGIFAANVTTSLSAVPADFLGDVACSTQAGAMRSYVATATDVTDPEHPLTLGSSVPTPCSQAALFRFVVVGHVYTAAIDGYEQSADALTPLAEASSGSRHVVLRGGDPSALVAPRWTTTCGVAGVTAVDDERVPFRPCDALVDHADEPTPTAVEVDPLATLGLLTCSGKPGGSVFAFEAVPEDPSLAPQPAIACGGAPLVWSEGVSAGTTYRFRVLAYLVPDIAVPSMEASCTVLAREGLLTLADCTPLHAIENAN
jgi:hypothetical protein